MSQLDSTILGFLRQIAAKVVSPDVFTGLCQELEDAKNGVWVPSTRLGKSGMQVLPVNYTTNKDQKGVGYYLELEFELTEPEEHHMFTWFLPVDPSNDMIVGHLKGEEIKSWSRFATADQEQKLN